LVGIRVAYLIGMRTLKTILTIVALTLALYPKTSDAHAIRVTNLNTLRTIYKVAKKRGVDAQHLIKIAFMESTFKENAYRVNKNGTVDVGIFQINSVHWTTTCKEFDVFTLVGNTECAAKIVKKIQLKHSMVDKHWLGRYHSKTPSKKIAYSNKLSTLVVMR